MTRHGLVHAGKRERSTVDHIICKQLIAKLQSLNVRKPAARHAADPLIPIMMSNTIVNVQSATQVTGIDGNC